MVTDLELGAAVSKGKMLLFAHYDSFHLKSHDISDNRALLLLRLWALCICAVAALDEGESEWYVSRIRTLMDDLQLRTSVEVELELGKYIWMPINSATFHNITWPKLEEISALAEI